jgi:hypothetical protein
VSGGNNVAIGSSALYYNQVGNNNSALGFQTLYNNVSGDNSALGFKSLYTNVSGGNNVAIGSSALYSNQVGNNNSALGFKSLYNNISGDNSAFGYQSLYTNMSGGNNVAIGSSALYSNQVGNNNSALGFKSLYNNISGDNSAFGYQSLYTNVSGGNNVAIGSSALYKNLSGENNVAIGTMALFNNKNSCNSALGYYTDICGSYSRSTAIGAYSNITADNQIVLGTDAEYVYIPGKFLYNPTIDQLRKALVVDGDVSFNRSVYVGTTVITSSIQTKDTTLNICTDTSQIGGRQIIIGTTNDTILINGNLKTTTSSTLEITSLQIILNAGSITYDKSAQSGIYIRDNSNNEAGYIRVSNKDTNLGLTSYNFKAPGGPNVIKFDIGRMVIDAPIENKNMVMKLIKSPYTDSSYSMVASSLDISNIFIKDIARSQDLTNNTQKISTNLGISGNLFINKDYIGIPDTALDVSGNVIISKLGIGAQVVNSNYYLEVSGNMTQSIGWIHQF